MSAKFNATKEEFALIAKIAGRAKFLSRGTGSEYQMADCVMDIEAAHCSGNPLMLAELLGANDGDFCHDVFGIRRHINRETGVLDGCFSPRYSVPEGSKQTNDAPAAEATAHSEGGGGGAAPVSPVQDVDSDAAQEVVALLPNEQVGALAEIAALSGSSFDEVLSQAVGFSLAQAEHVFGVTLDAREDLGRGQCECGACAQCGAGGGK